jgi:toxin ParE1/3/4
MGLAGVPERTTQRQSQSCLSRQIILSQKARVDLASIWDYAAQAHGLAQADSYIADIDRIMALALDFPNMGMDYSDIREGYRKLGSGYHLIFYLPRIDGIEIVRVLHERMDIEAHL